MTQKSTVWGPGLPDTKTYYNRIIKAVREDFPGGPVVKNPPAKAGKRVQSPAREDCTDCRATKPACHKY